MVSLYYALPKEKKSNCDRFNLSVQVFEGTWFYFFSISENILLHLTFSSLTALPFFSLRSCRLRHLVFASTEKLNEVESVYKLTVKVLWVYQRGGFYADMVSKCLSPPVTRCSCSQTTTVSSQVQQTDTQTPADTPQRQRAQARKDSCSLCTLWQLWCEIFRETWQVVDVCCCTPPPWPRPYPPLPHPLSLSYKSKERDATMSILDIGLLTGFTYDTTDLDKVKLMMEKMTRHINEKSVV